MSDTWTDLEEIFSQALKHPPADRKEFLKSQLVSERLQQRLEQLVDAHENMGSFLEQPLPAKLQSMMEGVRAGPWRIVKPIGAGGMGLVFLAERADGAFEQQAALKLIRPELQTNAVAERFLQERQVLARLNHPNIARLIDGGITAAGQYFLVMEMVRGKPVDQYCNEHGLSTRERVRLVEQLCDAVQYLHQNLIIHADLKPGNVFVTLDGRVKLLDFGTARLLEPAPQDQDSPPTRTFRQLTPEYASPEQLRGENLNTLTDVYSLGLILYRLLGGCIPFAAPHSAIRSQEPVRSSRSRGVDSDLEVIALKCLRTDPAQRFSGVEQIASEIRRWLAGLPIESRRENWQYVASTFIKRHRTALLGGIFVIVSLTAALLGMTLQARRAERNLAAVRALSSAILANLPDGGNAVVDSRAAVARLLNIVAELDRIGNSLSDRSLHTDLAGAYRHAGESFARTGEREAAMAAHTASIRFAREALKERPNDFKRLTLVECLFSFGQTLFLAGEPSKSALFLEEGIQLSRGVKAAPPRESWFRERISAMWSASGAYAQQARFEKARPLLVESVEIAKEWGAQLSGNRAEAQSFLAETWVRLAITAKATDDTDAANRACTEALRLDDSKQRAKSACADTPAEYAPRPVSRLQELVTYHAELTSTDPYNRTSKLGLWNSWRRLGERLAQTGAEQQARHAYEKARQVMQAEYERTPEDPRVTRYLAISLERSAQSNQRLRRSAEALLLLRQADSLRRRLAQRDPTNMHQRGEAANTSVQIGELLGSQREALDYLQRGLSEHETIAAVHPGFAPALDVVLDCRRIGDWYRRNGDRKTGAVYYGRGKELLSRLHQRFPQYRRQTAAAARQLQLLSNR